MTYSEQEQNEKDHPHSIKSVSDLYLKTKARKLKENGIIADMGELAYRLALLEIQLKHERAKRKEMGLDYYMER